MVMKERVKQGRSGEDLEGFGGSLSHTPQHLPHQQEGYVVPSAMGMQRWAKMCSLAPKILQIHITSARLHGKGYKCS